MEEGEKEKDGPEAMIEKTREPEGRIRDENHLCALPPDNQPVSGTIPIYYTIHETAERIRVHQYGKIQRVKIRHYWFGKWGDCLQLPDAFEYPRAAGSSTNPPQFHRNSRNTRIPGVVKHKNERKRCDSTTSAL